MGAMAGKNNRSVKHRLSDDSFLEAFRDLGSDLASTTTENLKAGLNDVREAFFPFTQNNEPSRQSPSPDQKEESYRSKFQKVEIIRRQEQILFTRHKRETQQQLTILQDEIKKLAQTTANLAGEAQQAQVIALQEIPQAGEYHLNFLRQIIKLISNLRAQLQESSYWLAAWNKKSQRKNYYWGQFKKSGSKFLLSSDRYVATQTG